ncbi:Protein CBG23202 [Caenorhabditis briggsae]|nr:Protein CBG23202 [Caenorhabditis briggsae]CAP39788.2 Protein CBG23202 [Caenorhabditis briggsae]
MTPNEMQSMNAAIDAECPICQCRMVVPTAVPGCRHWFCFTCLKGVCMNEQCPLCPMCRGKIDLGIFNLPSRDLDLKMDVPISPVVVQKNRAGINRADGNTTVSPIDFDDTPEDLSKEDQKKMYWLYRGKSQGWWRFDPRHEREIEESYLKGKLQCEVLICGRTYIIDFQRKCQYLQNQPSQAREVTRVSAEEFDGMEVKGLAGVFVPTS